jgi:hypothetical protein
MALLFVFGPLSHQRGSVLWTAQLDMQGAPAPMSTPTPPSAARLLARSSVSSHSRGSVQEIGAIVSSNDHVLDTRHFSANYSWFRHIYKDRERFRIPTDLSAQIKNVKQVSRIVIGPWVSAFAGGQWFCKKAGVSANSAYWVIPGYKLNNPAIVGSTMVNGERAWIVQGKFVGQAKGSRSDLTVRVVIDQKKYLIRRATESGTVHMLGRPAHVEGTLSYTQYGAPVNAKLPSVCHS